MKFLVLFVALVFVVLQIADVWAGEEGNDCSYICTYDFDPVCGRKFGGKTRTFGNQCIMDGINSCLTANEVYTSIPYPCQIHDDMNIDK
ncbi:vasotab-TY1-like [Eupeodes corollae]|uniref:vasotab-TY1-like n=1 Tax=Eupeodes corollae TaxID=290404 RepID=UPI002490ECC2|nr:vasotab-TY1-like [Eupeodes corollae]